MNKPFMIFDAIHQVMEIDETLVGKGGLKTLKKIIDCPYFQRLKGIKQLGLADMVFPTATHSRFSHSVGAAYLAAKILKQLRETDSARHIVVAALLHDIGHGPFSHAFEDFFKQYLNQEIKHETWTKTFIEYLDLPDPDIIADLIITKEKKNFRHDIISSGLDCDRLDYLLRDSHFCGVSYGTFDLDWLLHTLIVIDLDDRTTLGVSFKGLGAIENYLVNRRLMYLNICQNRKILGFTDNLVVFLVEVASWVDEPGHKTEKERITGSLLFKFLEKINRYGDVIADSFDFYKCLTDFDLWAAIRNVYYTDHVPDSLKTIAQSFMERRSPKVRQIKSEKEGEINKYIKAEGLTKYQINIIKPNFQFYDANYADIYIQYERPYKIQEKSPILEKLFNLKEERVFLKCASAIFPEVEKELEDVFI